MGSLAKLVNESTNTETSSSPVFGSLKSRVFRAGSWTLIGYVASLALRLLSTLITTRIFEPEVFGVVATSMAIYVAIHFLTDIGLWQAVIRSPNGEDRTFLNTAWTLQQVRGWLIWCICAGLAAGLFAADRWGWTPPGSVYASPILPAVIVVTAFSVVILSMQSMKVVALNRAINLKRITLVELIAQIVSLTFIISVGWITRSIWSFIAGGLVASMVTTLLSHIWLRGPTDRFAWDRESLRELMHFGKWIFLASAPASLTINGDRLLLAGAISPTELGYYSIASTISGTVDGAANRLFSVVMMPALSEGARQEPHRVSAIYFRIRWVMDTVMIAAAGFLFSAGDWIIHFLYDPRYAQAGWMLEWLSFGLVFARYTLAQSVYMSLGRPNYLVALNFVTLGSLFVMVPLLFHSYGIPGAVIGIAFHKLPAVLLVFWFNRRHQLNNFRLELAVLCVWPLGWLMGYFLTYV